MILSFQDSFAKKKKLSLFWNCVLHKQMMLPVKELKLQWILQRYLIQEAISHTGGVKDITSTHIESVIGLLSKRTGSMVNLPQRRKARIQYEFLIIEKESFSEHKEENQDLQSPNSKIGKAVYSIFPVCEKKIPQTCCVNWFDYDTIKEGLLMRKRRPKSVFALMQRVIRKSFPTG